MLFPLLLNPKSALPCTDRYRFAQFKLRALACPAPAHAKYGRKCARIHRDDYSAAGARGHQRGSQGLEIISPAPDLPPVRYLMVLLGPFSRPLLSAQTPKHDLPCTHASSSHDRLNKHQKAS